MESYSTTFPLSILNAKFRYFENELKSLSMNNINGVIISQINVNSIRSKFDDLVKGVRVNLYILMISETKIDASFPTSQFSKNGYTSPYRLDRNGKRKSILTYFRVDISSKFITANFPNAEGFF